MKALTWIGIVSLAGNAALLGVIATGAWRQTQIDVTTKSVPAPIRGAAQPVASAVTWDEIGTPDLASFRDRLTTEGFPPAVIRTILAAQIRERNAARRKAVEAKVGELPFWKVGYDAATQAEFRAIDRDEMRELKELLGAAYYSETAERFARQFPDLSREKIDQVVAIRARYDEQRMDFFAVNRGMFMPLDQEKITALDKAMHAELATVMTPGELENYDLRMSNAANQLRYTLGNLELNEAEFRAVYRLQTAFDEQYSGRSIMTPEQSRARMDAQKQLNTEIAAALGSDRYGEFERAKDYNFKQTSLLMTRLGLPAETATALYKVQKEFEQQRTAMFAGGTVDAARATEFFSAQQKEVGAKVQTILGGNSTAIDAYYEYGGGWLKNMVPRTRGATKK